MSERYTSEYTPCKQQHFQQIVRTHLRICSGIISRTLWLHRHYFYLDLYAGAGSTQKAAPVLLIFAEEAYQQKVRFDAYLIEEEALTMLDLIRNVKEWKEDHALWEDYYMEPIWGENQKCVPELLATIYDNRPRYGLVYVDPPGNVPSFDTLKTIALEKRFKCVDILLYLSGANWKRFRKAAACSHSDYLLDALKSTGKEHIHIREPQGRHQWTFALLTNWAGMPEFTTLGFHRLNTPEGRAVMDKLNFTTEELANVNTR